MFFFKSKQKVRADDALARAVAAVNPLLIHADGYPKHFRKAIVAALDHADKLAHALPEPITITTEAYTQDALVRALFPDVSKIQVAATSSPDFQKYLQTIPPGQDVYALMGMQRKEKKVIGMETSGMTIRRDVMQNITYFDRHLITLPHDNEAALRTKLSDYFFDILIQKVKEQISIRQTEKNKITQEIDFLLSRMRVASEEERAQAEQKVAALNEKLPPLLSTLSLSYYVKDFEGLLLNPEVQLSLKPVEVILDTMGIQRDEVGAHDSSALTFYELAGHQIENWTITLIKYKNVLPEENFSSRLDKAAKHLSL